MHGGRSITSRSIYPYRGSVAERYDGATNNTLIWRAPTREAWLQLVCIKCQSELWTQSFSSMTITQTTPRGGPRQCTQNFLGVSLQVANFYQASMYWCKIWTPCYRNSLLCSVLLKTKRSITYCGGSPVTPIKYSVSSLYFLEGEVHHKRVIATN